MTRFRLLLIIITVLFSSFGQVKAQVPSEKPIYIVQSGDTIGSIAQRFFISTESLLSANGITNPNLLSIGTRLVIPGFTGMSGVLITRPVAVSESLQSISIRSKVATQQLLKINRITSPNEILAGVNLILPENSKDAKIQTYSNLLTGQSPLEAAVIANTSIWKIALTNRLESSRPNLPGDAIYLESTDNKSESSAISPAIHKVEILPLPLVQGKTITVRVIATKPVNLTGSLAGNSLKFFEEKPNQYVAIQGIHAMAKPGIAEFSLASTGQEYSQFSYEENILLKGGYFINDPPLNVDPATIDPNTTKAEEEQVKKILQITSRIRAWSDHFVMPVDETICLQSTFGNRRSYNNSPLNYFHSGVDFGVCKNLNIYATAPGKVVFAGPLTVRGNATIIDHGWGIFSGYWHQSEIKVKIGESVKSGQLIGLIGKTGRVTGPHLHWEILANGIQVEPLDWLDNKYPQ